MNNKFIQAQEIVKKYNQEHLLKFYDNLDEGKKEILINQILETDFSLIENLYGNINMNKQEQDKITPISYTDKSKLTETEIEEYKAKGAELIKENKYAILTMAGGQGTRLGHNGPKGTFKLELNPAKSLFELFCEQLKKTKGKYNVTIPWYLMTSKENNAETIEFFEKK